MRTARTLLPLLLLTLCVPAIAQAAVDAKPFVAPGLWLIVSDVHGPMGEHSTLTQQECWNAQGSSGQALLPLQGGRQGAVTHQVVNTGHQSTVHLHTEMQLPKGTMTQDITLVFTRGSVIRQATMTGHGGMTDTASPILDETFSQTGHWISATCPQTLPPPTRVVLQKANIPGLTALQNLARQMQAQQAHTGTP